VSLARLTGMMRRPTTGLALVSVLTIGWLACVGDDPAVDQRAPDPNIPEGGAEGSAPSDAAADGPPTGGDAGGDADADACAGDAKHVLHLPPNGFLKISHHATLLLAQSHTIEFWARFKSPNSSGLVFGKLQPGVEDKALEFVNDDTCYWTLFNEPPVFVTCNPSPYGLWHHYALSNDGVTGRHYVDGKRETQDSTVSLAADGTGDLYFGKNPTRAGLDGGPANPVGVDMDLAEIRISNKARETGAGPVPTPMRLVDDGPTIGLWHLDEKCGQSAADSSSFARHATVSPEATWVKDDR
jgi:hypothetical protein